MEPLRISQLMSLLRWRTIITYIDRLDGTEGACHLTARRLRDIAVLDDHGEQRARFRDLVGDRLATSPPMSSRVAPKA